MYSVPCKALDIKISKYVGMHRSFVRRTDYLNNLYQQKYYLKWVNLLATIYAQNIEVPQNSVQNLVVKCLNYHDTDFYRNRPIRDGLIRVYIFSRLFYTLYLWVGIVLSIHNFSANVLLDVTERFTSMSYDLNGT